MIVVDEYVEYYLYNEKGVSGTTTGTGIKLARHRLAFLLNKTIDQNKNIVLSYLHKAIKHIKSVKNDRRQHGNL